MRNHAGSPSFGLKNVFREERGIISLWGDSLMAFKLVTKNSHGFQRGEIFGWGISGW